MSIYGSLPYPQPQDGCVNPRYISVVEQYPYPENDLFFTNNIFPNNSAYTPPRMSFSESRQSNKSNGSTLSSRSPTWPDQVFDSAVPSPFITHPSSVESSPVSLRHLGSPWEENSAAQLKTCKAPKSRGTSKSKNAVHGSISSGTPQPLNPVPSTAPAGQYPCLWDGDCNSTFSRPFDRNRHMQTHWPEEAKPRFECPEAKTVPWCNRTGDNAFTREDHRDQHRRKVHMIELPPKPRGVRGKNKN